MVVLGGAETTRFAGKHPNSRKPLARFLEIARMAEWPHFPAVRLSFLSADYAPESGTIIFNIGGNKYRLIAAIDFDEQVLLIQSVLTHEKYNREKL
jgi:mRNA interferase HigB